MPKERSCLVVQWDTPEILALAISFFAATSVVYDELAVVMLAVKIFSTTRLYQKEPVHVLTSRMTFPLIERYDLLLSTLGSEKKHDPSDPEEAF